MNKYLMRMEKKRESIFLALLCFFTYATIYIGRLNYSAALPGMIASGLITKTQGGMIATAYFAAYGFGQLVNGFLADRYNPYAQVTIGIVSSAALNMLMAVVRTPALMLLVWGLNGYAQSLVWAPAFLIVFQCVSDECRNSSLLLINSAPSAGTIFAYIYSSTVLRISAWKSLFFWASAILGAGTLVWVIGIRMICRHEKHLPEAQKTSDTNKTAGKTDGAHENFLRILGPSLPLLIIPAMIHGMLKDGVTSWLPTYMTEVFSMSAENAVMFTVILPLINISGAAVAFWLMSRMHNEVLCALLLFGISGACLVLLTALGNLSAVLAVVLFALVTAAMMAVNVTLCSQVAARFGAKGISGAISGFFNACGYIGTAVSMYGIAWIAENCGWGVTRLMWGISCVVAIVFCVAAVPFWKQKIKELDE